MKKVTTQTVAPCDEACSRPRVRFYDPALDTTFKVFVMDEAWRFLKNDTIRQYITEAVKTWRKRNAAMVSPPNRAMISNARKC